jgi:hypothetical protein
MFCFSVFYNDTQDSIIRQVYINYALVFVVVNAVIFFVVFVDPDMYSVSLVSSFLFFVIIVVFVVVYLAVGCNANISVSQVNLVFVFG